MSTANTATYELRQILTDYLYDSAEVCLNIERVKNLLSDLSDEQKYDLISSIKRGDGVTVLKEAARGGHTVLCYTLLSSLPQADRLKLTLADISTALHSAAWRDHTKTISFILVCLTAEQQLQLLFTQNSDGNTALHYAALKGSTDTMKALLNRLTPEQQLQLRITQNSQGNTALHFAARVGHTNKVKTMLDYVKITPEEELRLLSVQNKEGITASEGASGRSITTGTMRTIKQYEQEAVYGVNYRKFAKLT